jgi:hypothetical protein
VSLPIHEWWRLALLLERCENYRRPASIGVQNAGDFRTWSDELRSADTIETRWHGKCRFTWTQHRCWRRQFLLSGIAGTRNKR